MDQKEHLASTVVQVSESEVPLVLEARRIENAAHKRTEEEEKKSGLISGMIFYGGSEEAAVIRARDELAQVYQKERGLQRVPILSVPPRNTPDFGFHICGQHQHSNPTAMELEHILLSRVHLRRQGETIYCWTGSYFQRMSGEELRTLIHGTLRNELSISGAAGQIRNVETLLLAEPEIKGIPIDNSSELLCVGNGVLDLRSLTLQPPSPSHFFTSQIAVPWEGQQPCPRFSQFLWEIAGGDAELIQRLWQSIGYVLVPENKAKRFLLLQGKGDTGKSVLGMLLRSFFNPEAVAGIDIFRFSDRFSLSAIVDRRLNISMDLPDRALGEQAVGMLKQITGGDMVQVEEKYKATYPAIISCKLIFGTNHSLRLSSVDQAFLNRVLLIPFAYPVPKERQDRNLIEALKQERSGILFQALHSYKELVRNGYYFAGDHRFSLSNQVLYTEATRDGLGEFIRGYCIEDATGATPIEEIHIAYKGFCQQEGLPFEENRAAFSRAFNEAVRMYIPNISTGKKRVDGVPKNVYYGVSILENSVYEGE